MLGMHTNGTLSRDHGITMELGRNFSGILAGVKTHHEHLRCRLQSELFEGFAPLHKDSWWSTRCGSSTHLEVSAAQPPQSRQPSSALGAAHPLRVLR